jgi:hypothetical protein
LLQWEASTQPPELWCRQFNMYYYYFSRNALDILVQRFSIFSNGATFALSYRLTGHQIIKEGN